MSFFSDENHLFLLLKQDRIQLFNKKNEPWQLIFPPGAVIHQEISDKKLLEKTIKDFLTPLKQHEVIIFLDNELVFQKNIPAGSKETLIDEENRFFNDIPFPRENVVKKTMEIAVNIWLFSANRELYQVIMLLLEQQGWRVSYVVPLLLFAPATQNNPLSFSFFLQIIKDKSSLEKGNLLHENSQQKQIKPDPTQTPVDKPKSPLIQYITLGISICIFAGILLFALSYLGILPSFIKK